jgi:hypothetical protein
MTTNMAMNKRMNPVPIRQISMDLGTDMSMFAVGYST